MHHINAEGKKRHVKHWLCALRSMADEMRAKEERIERLRALMEGMRSLSGESVSGGTKRDLSDAQGELDKLMDEYAGDLARYASDIATGYIICPPDDLPRYVCWLHWAEGLTWYQVGAKVGYSSSHCKQWLCSLGVEAIYDDMPRQWMEDVPSSL